MFDNYGVQQIIRCISSLNGKQGNGAYENYPQYFEDDGDLFDKFRDKLYKFTQRLFQNYLDCFVNKNAEEVHKSA